MPVRTTGAPPRPLPPAPSWSRLRVAVTAVFAYDGFVFGSWAARIPDVTAQVGATHATLGVALLCVSLGALASMQATGALCARFGSGVVARAGTVGLCAAAPLPGLAPSVPVLCAALTVFGAVTGLVNVAANSAGVEVAAGRPGRPLLPALHAAFSFGGLAGAAVGALAAVLGPVAPHLAAVAVVGTVVVGTARPLTHLARPRPTAAPDGPARVGSRGPILLLGAVAGATAFGEGSLTDWGALHLTDTLGASTGVAAAGYAGFSLAMATGRLAGGPLLRRTGETPLLVGGALLAAAGSSTALLTTSVPVAVAGFVATGLGLANLFPVTIARAGVLGGAGGVALASTVGYAGLLGGPPVIGFVAEHAGLAVALGTVPALALAAAALAPWVAPRPARTAHPAVLRTAARRWTSVARAAVLRGAAALSRCAAELPVLTDGGPDTNRPARIRPYPGLEMLAA